MTVDLNQSSKALLVGLLNEEKQLSIIADQVVFSDITAGNTANTRIKITALGSSQYLGDTDFEYNRIDIESIFGNYSPIIVGDAYAIGSTLDVIVILNEIYGLQLDSNDVIDYPVTDSTHTVVIADESLAWMGQVEVTIINNNPIPSGAVLLDSGAPFSLDSGSILVM